MAVLQDENNIPPDCQTGPWNGTSGFNHRQLDAPGRPSGRIRRYHPPMVAIRDQWEEWVGDDFVSSYMGAADRLSACRCLRRGAQGSLRT